MKFGFRLLFAIGLFTSFFPGCFFGDDDKPIRTLPPPIPPLEKLANSLSEGGVISQRKRLIVLTFTNGDGSKNPYGQILAEKLTTELVKKDKYLVLDRMVHERILKEKDLGLETDQNMATLRKIGEVLKLDVIVTGIVSGYQDGVYVNSRLIEIKSGLILKAEEVFVPIDG